MIMDSHRDASTGPRRDAVEHAVSATMTHLAYETALRTAALVRQRSLVDFLR
jgi:hypothetical protein